MSQARSDEQLLVSQANILPSPSVVEYSRVMGVGSESTTHPFDDVEAARILTERATSSGNDEAGKKLNNTESLTMRRSSSESLKETARNTDHHGILHEEPLEIQCGEKNALLFVSKLCQGSKGPCILYGNDWLTPNELQYICGRETAKDWKRSIRHKGKSLKSLIAQGFLKVHPPICDCPGCRVSSPVNRTRLADKCGFSKIPSYLTEKSMVEGFPTMWRRSSTSSDEADQPTALQGSDSLAEDESQPKRAHSDEPRYYRPSEEIQVTKRPRSSSPDLDRGRFNTKRRCVSETSAGLPALTLPSSSYRANVLYAHTPAHHGLHRHVTSPRLLSPSFLRPSSTASAQIRLLHEQAVGPLSPHIYTQQLRQDYSNVGMTTMFPYSFTHPLPNNQILSTHFQKLTPEMERLIANTAESSVVGTLVDQKHDKNVLSQENKHASGISSPPGSDKGAESLSTSEKSHQSSLEESIKYARDETDNQVSRVYPELAQIAAQWDVEEVCKFVNSVTGCNDYSEVFRDQEIDGQALILLTEDHLSNKMGIKLGPALKIKSKIDELRCVYTK